MQDDITAMNPAMSRTCIRKTGKKAVMTVRLIGRRRKKLGIQKLRLAFPQLSYVIFRTLRRKNWSDDHNTRSFVMLITYQRTGASDLARMEFMMTVRSLSRNCRAFGMSLATWLVRLKTPMEVSHSG
jgi:hypothetical protein